MVEGRKEFSGNAGSPVGAVQRAKSAYPEMWRVCEELAKWNPDEDGKSFHYKAIGIEGVPRIVCYVAGDQDQEAEVSALVVGPVAKSGECVHGQHEYQQAKQIFSSSGIVHSGFPLNDEETRERNSVMLMRDFLEGNMKHFPEYKALMEDDVENEEKPSPVMV